MKLTEEFRKAKEKVLTQETSMDTILDKAINGKLLHINDVSDRYLEQHLNDIAALYEEISHKTELLYKTPITKSRKSFLKMHADNLSEVQPALVEIIHKMEDQVQKDLLDPDHSLILAKIVIGLSNLVDNHNRLTIEFVNMVKKDNGNKPSAP
ncbi:MAG: hypothetical protein NZ828_01545 [Alphaproteobacteria bacterium]|nr:hypothetical protein [Alphaproteobacteria bacterium]